MLSEYYVLTKASFVGNYLIIGNFFLTIVINCIFFEKSNRKYNFEILFTFPFDDYVNLGSLPDNINENDTLAFALPTRVLMRSKRRQKCTTIKIKETGSFRIFVCFGVQLYFESFAIRLRVHFFVLNSIIFTMESYQAYQ